MIKSVSKVMGFYDRVRVLVKNALAEEPSLRPKFRPKLVANLGYFSISLNSQFI